MLQTTELHQPGMPRPLVVFPTASIKGGELSAVMAQFFNNFAPILTEDPPQDLIIFEFIL